MKSNVGHKLLCDVMINLGTAGLCQVANTTSYQCKTVDILLNEMLRGSGIAEFFTAPFIFITSVSFTQQKRKWINNEQFLTLSMPNVDDNDSNLNVILQLCKILKN